MGTYCRRRSERSPRQSRDETPLGPDDTGRSGREVGLSHARYWEEHRSRGTQVSWMMPSLWYSSQLPANYYMREHELTREKMAGARR